MSEGWPHFAATSAISAAPKNGSQSKQIRSPKFESQNESSCGVLHRPHLPRAFSSNGLIARLILMFMFFGTHSSLLDGKRY